MKHLILGCLIALPAYALADAPPKGPDFDAHMPTHGVDSSLTASSGSRPIEPSDDVIFANDSTWIDSTATASIENTSRWLHDHPGFCLVLEGHASSPGTAAHNEDLATARICMVRDRLLRAGIAADRIVMVVFGERGAQPDPNPNDRRVIMYATLQGPQQVVSASLRHENAISAAWTRNGALITERRLTAPSAISSR